MPVVLAVNGAVETYRPRSVTGKPKVADVQRYGQDPPQHQGQAGLDITVLAARMAYEKSQAPQTRKPAILAQDIMSVPVLTVRPEATLTEAWALMKSKGFRHLPVTSATGALVGIASDRDLLGFSSLLEATGHAPSLTHPISAIMSTEVLTATTATDIRELARVMLHERISALPIIDAQHHPVGIVTISDILRRVMTHAPLELWT
ncbi:MAG: CBS domain-containing protein [Nitrospirota bacterium]